MKMRMLGLVLVLNFFFIGMNGCGKDSSVPEEEPIVITETKLEHTLKPGESIILAPDLKPEKNGLSYSWVVNGEEKGTEAAFSLTTEQLIRGINNVSLSVSSTEGEIGKIDYTVYALNSSATKKIGYWLSYEGSPEPTDTQLQNLTHIICSFWEVSANGDLQSGTTNDRLEKMIKKAHRNGTYFMMAVGGGANSSFGDCVTDTDARNHLVDNIAAYSSSLIVDGIDIDFEGWSGGGSADDKQKSDGLLDLLSNLREVLPGNILLTMPVTTVDWVNYNYVPAMYQYLDWVGLMLYDYTATWSDSPYGNHASYDDFVTFINYWMDTKLLPREKVVAGLPFYGYKFANESGGLGDAMVYKKIIEQYPDANTKDQIGNLFYNGQPTINKKCQYVLDNNLQGILIWEIMQDVDIANSKSLLKTVNSVLAD